MLDRLDFTTHRIATLDEAVAELVGGDSFSGPLALLRTIPGIQALSAATILAELGTDMRPFPSAAHLASWCGLCPGQKESAGVRASGRIRNGNTYLKTVLVECAWCAVRSKDTYLRAKYYKLIPRMGKRKAMVAIAHKLIIACYYVLRDGVAYRELGGDYLDQKKQQRMIAYHLKALQKLGYEDEAAAAATAAATAAVTA